MREVARTLVDGHANERVVALDRGLAYGDGLFESMLVVNGRAPLWSRHMARLARGGERLALPMPEPDLLQAEVETTGAGLERAVVRITITRGVGPRGYAMPRDPRSTRIVAAFPALQMPAAAGIHGVRVRLCDLRLGEQPQLAGIKHLNRLEQVLARAEWDNADIFEGLLRDAHDRVISATAANLFVLIDGCLVTPSLERCGVAGVARAEILSIRPDCRIRDVSVNDVMNADELFLSSSIRGIVPITALEDRRWPPGAVARAMQAHWHDLGLTAESGT